ncbi:MAG: hypothetical protein HRT66_06020 [Flavobacteriaceae bacterium]|nr:hypothetical protein [Flavobacteriaceae bacterium]
MKKDIMIIGLIIASMYCSAQLKKAETSLSLNIQKEDVNFINWTLNDSKSEIIIYSHNATKANMKIEYLDTKPPSKENKQKIDYILEQNYPKKDRNYNHTSYIYEKRIDLNKMTIRDTIGSKNVFHNIDDLPSNLRVYDYNYPKSSLQNKYLAQYYYKDINTVLPYFTKLNEAYKTVEGLEFRGDGFFGTTKMRPITYKGTYEYITKEHFSNFFRVKKEVEIVKELASAEEFKDYKLIDYPGNIKNKDIDIFWFHLKKDFSKYKVVVYNNNTKEYKVQDIVFDADRKLRSYGKPVYDDEMNITGLISVFGYHKNGYETYKKTDFQIVRFDNKGKLKQRIDFEFGDENTYKRIVNPVFAIEDRYCNLRIFNVSNISSTEKIFQTINLSKRGDINLSYRDKASIYLNKKFKGELLNKINHISKVGDNYVLYSKSEQVIVVNGQSKQSSQPYYNLYGFDIFVLDKNFIPIDHYGKEPFSVSDIDFIELETSTNKVKLLSNLGDNQYYLIEIEEDGLVREQRISRLVPDQEFEDVEFLKESLFDLSSDVIVDSQNKCFYLARKYNLRIEKKGKESYLEKVLIQKIVY